MHRWLHFNFGCFGCWSPRMCFPSLPGALFSPQLQKRGGRGGGCPRFPPALGLAPLLLRETTITLAGRWVWARAQGKDLARRPARPPSTQRGCQTTSSRSRGHQASWNQIFSAGIEFATNSRRPTGEDQLVRRDPKPASKEARQQQGSKGWRQSHGSRRRRKLQGPACKMYRRRKEGDRLRTRQSKPNI